MSRSPLEHTRRSTPVRRKQRGTHERGTIHAILDEGLVCHVGLVHEGSPVVLPTAYVRVGDQIYLHGSPSNHMFDALASGAEACVTVTLVDALVLAKTAGHHSLNYRSVVLFGRGRRVTDEGELRTCLRAIVEAALPGRYDHAHGASDLDLRTTLVVAIPIEEGSAKVRDAGPAAEEEDARGFVGIVPLRQLPERAIATVGSRGVVPHVSSVARMRPEEMPTVRAVLRRAYGWDDARERVVEERLARYVRAQPDGWFVVRAQRDGGSDPEIAAAGGCFVFDGIAFFGLVGVAPELQRRGIGRLLMDRLARFADAHGATTLLLDASPAGAPLYETMGFTTIDETQVYARTSPIACASPSARVRAATKDDFEELVRLDAEAYGGGRARLLEACLADGRALVHADGGFCIAQSSHIGPVVARSVEIAAELLDAALALDYARAPDVLTRASHRDIQRLLTERGFTHARSLKHMQRGGSPRDPRPMIFAQQSLATG